MVCVNILGTKVMDNGKYKMEQDVWQSGFAATFMKWCVGIGVLMWCFAWFAVGILDCIDSGYFGILVNDEFPQNGIPWKGNPFVSMFNMVAGHLFVLSNVSCICAILVWALWRLNDARWKYASIFSLSYVVSKMSWVFFVMLVYKSPETYWHYVNKPVFIPILLFLAFVLLFFLTWEIILIRRTGVVKSDRMVWKCIGLASFTGIWSFWLPLFLPLILYCLYRLFVKCPNPTAV